MRILYCRFAYSSAAWSGNKTILDKVMSFYPELPEVPAYMNSVLPRFSQVGTSLRGDEHGKRKIVPALSFGVLPPSSSSLLSDAQQG